MAIKVSDLKDQLGKDRGPWQPPFLYCDLCHSECSAHKGDYFMYSPDHVFMCCEEPMKLMRKTILLEEVKP